MTGNMTFEQETELIDAVELGLLNVEGASLINFELKHSFIPGFYVRQIFMPAGSRLTSKTHRTTHPYHISKGKLIVWNKGQWMTIQAPFSGITEPETRRAIKIIEDTVWTTFHPFSQITGDENNYSETEKLELVAEIEKLLAEQRENPLLGITYNELKQKSLSNA